jgi:hypothetical protein
MSSSRPGLQNLLQKNHAVNRGRKDFTIQRRDTHVAIQMKRFTYRDTHVENIWQGIMDNVWVNLQIQVLLDAKIANKYVTHSHSHSDCLLDISKTAHH